MRALFCTQTMGARKQCYLLTLKKNTSGNEGEKVRKEHEEWLSPEKLLLIAAWARNGLTQEQIAKNIGISRKTLGVWAKEHKKIEQALKKKKEVADIEVENSLFKRANGYKSKEVTKELVKDPVTGKLKLMTVKEVIKEVPPDPTSMIYYLNNRKPDEWRNKRTHVEKISDEYEGVMLVSPVKEETDEGVVHES